MKKKVNPPSYFTVLLVLTIFLHFFFPIKKIILFPWNYLGLLCIISGGGLTLWVDRLIKKTKTAVKPYEIPKRFIVNGPFKISRNPMYLGMLMVSLGISVFLGSLITFVFPVIFFVIINNVFIPIEEKNMEKRFKEKYKKYKKDVRRWI